jgi:hypothetical protein
MACEEERMKQWCAFLLVVSIAAGLVPAGIARAQSGGLLPVTPGAGRYLPSAEAIGDGWREVSQAGIAPGPEFFREGVRAVYGGPDGTRALVYAWLTQDGEAAQQGAWEQTAAFFGTRIQLWAANVSSVQENEAGTPSPLAACSNVRQAEGVDPDTQFVGGFTLCAVDPDVIVLTIVSGELDGASGSEASDALLRIALEAGSD